MTSYFSHLFPSQAKALREQKAFCAESQNIAIVPAVRDAIFLFEKVGRMKRRPTKSIVFHVYTSESFTFNNNWDWLLQEATAYMAYGKQIVLKSPNEPSDEAREKFTGKELDQEAGMDLYEFGARKYDPEIGRFISTDPMDQFWDSYSYCGGDPVNLVDPDGEDGVPLDIGLLDMTKANSAFDAGEAFLSSGSLSMAMANASFTVNMGSDLGEPNLLTVTQDMPVVPTSFNRPYFTMPQMSTIEGEPSFFAGGSSFINTPNNNAAIVSNAVHAPFLACKAIMDAEINTYEAVSLIYGVGGIIRGGMGMFSASKSGLELGEQMGILREAAQGTGNFGLGRATAQEANMLGKSWVGGEYKISSDGTAWISKNGLCQYSLPSAKPNSPFAKTGIQANFEQRASIKGPWKISNGHLDIIP